MKITLTIEETRKLHDKGHFEKDGYIITCDEDGYYQVGAIIENFEIQLNREYDEEFEEEEEDE